MATISPEALELAVAAIDVQTAESDGRRLTSRIRTDINDPSVQLLLAEIAVRLGRIEAAILGGASPRDPALRLL